MHSHINAALCVAGIFLIAFCGHSQNSLDVINEYFQEEASNLELNTDDISDLIISDEHSSKINGITFCYVQQRYQGIPIYNTSATIAIQDNYIVLTGNRLLDNISDRIDNLLPSINAENAILSGANSLGLPKIQLNDINLIESEGNSYLLEAPSISEQDIPVKLLYFLTEEGKLRLAWDLSIEELNHQHWWSLKVDAQTGELLDKVDWVVSCQFESGHSEHKHYTNNNTDAFPQLPSPPPSTDQYNVFAIPLESPNHGSRSLVVGPSDPVASPYGWHDTDGQAGEEFTVARGNNVRATEDQNDDNSPGYTPDGGGTIDFDFPLDLNQPPTTNLDASITNLFYMNNIMHDVWYRYGFDEPSGNFQENNYGNGGNASDMVNADALDGSGTNNANFATPPDGNNPRMQMFLWDPPGPPGDIFSVNPPSIWAGNYSAAEADFGGAIPQTAITADLVIYEDGTPDTYDACQAPINGAAMNGKIVIMRAGTCDFEDKVLRAENEGALAVIMVDDAPQATFPMPGNGAGVTIPAVLINQYNGENLIAEIESGATVNVSLGNLGPYQFDSSFDNGIIAHEYGHGISTRLTGGANNSNCLSNDEQMGEGWSDWFGLMLTIEPGDMPEDVRGIGTYTSGEPITGIGIRPAPYSTDWNVNPYTYGSTNNVGNISQPHGIGFVWATMLWDLNWAMIDQYGFDSDVYSGSGGNNMTMHLVMTALKLQPCSPGFVDGRDAVLAADQLLYGGIHECLIWKVFAKRGLGYSADQGDSDDREDQVPAFDLPPGMDHSTVAVACESYTWSENGQTYTTSGIYTSPLGGVIGIGCDSEATLDLTIGDPGNVNTSVVAVNDVAIQATGSGLEYQWLDCDDSYAEISGEIFQSYTATENGNYAVQITENGCVDTSACMPITTIGIIENELGGNLAVFPNPTDGKLTVKLGETHALTTLRIFDIRGTLISELEVEQSDTFNFELSGAPGVYLIEIQSDNQRARIRVLKQ